MSSIFAVFFFINIFLLKATLIPPCKQPSFVFLNEKEKSKLYLNCVRKPLRLLKPKLLD